MILKYSADEARNLKSYGETIVMFVGFESCAFLLWSESLQVIMSWLLSHSSGEFPESVKINETVDFVGGKPHLVPFNVTFSFSQMSPPGDLDDDIEFDDVDSEGSGSDEGDDIDGI